MRVARFIHRHPLLLLAVVAAAFIAWVWAEPGQPRSALQTPSDEGPTREPGTLVRKLPAPPDASWADKNRPTPREAAQALPRLRPGMTRAEVEGLVGVPEAGDIHPAEVEGGRVTYRTSYEVDLGPPQTVRPIRPMPKSAPRATPQDRTLITLEFDATRPGHPLLGILYPDPLF